MYGPTLPAVIRQPTPASSPMPRVPGQLRGYAVRRRRVPSRWPARRAGAGALAVPADHPVPAGPQRLGQAEWSGWEGLLHKRLGVEAFDPDVQEGVRRGGAALADRWST